LSNTNNYELQPIERRIKEKGNLQYTKRAERKEEEDREN
jgi:hypothetical protein